MGADCSVDRSPNNVAKQTENNNNKADGLLSRLDNNPNSPKSKFSLDCKSYKDYNNKIEIIKIKFRDAIKKFEKNNEFKFSNK